MTPDVELSPPWECAHFAQELRTRRIAGGGQQYRKQCLTCGQSVGDSVSRKLVDLSPPAWDEDLHSQWRELQAAKSAEQRAAELESWRASHTRYLLSDAWRRKRQTVLKRDDHTCQGCHSAAATEVHHLTYANHGDELLFQLVSLCDACHRRVHAAGGSS